MENLKRNALARNNNKSSLSLSQIKFKYIFDPLIDSIYKLSFISWCSTIKRKNRILLLYYTICHQ